MNALVKMPKVALIAVFILGMMHGGCTKVSTTRAMPSEKGVSFEEGIVYSGIATFLSMERLRLLTDSFCSRTTEQMNIGDCGPEVDFSDMQLSIKCGQSRNTFSVKHLKIRPIANSEVAKLNPDEFSPLNSGRDFSNSTPRSDLSRSRFRFTELTSYIYSTEDLKSVFLTLDSNSTPYSDTSGIAWRVDFRDMFIRLSDSCVLESIEATGLESTYKVHIVFKSFDRKPTRQSWTRCIQEHGHITASAYICDSSNVTTCK